MSISQVESLCVEQFSDVSGDHNMGAGSSIGSVSPSLRVHKIVSVSTPSEFGEGAVDVSENDSIEIV